MRRQPAAHRARLLPRAVEDNEVEARRRRATPARRARRHLGRLRRPTRRVDRSKKGGNRQRVVGRPQDARGRARADARQERVVLGEAVDEQRGVGVREQQQLSRVGRAQKLLWVEKQPDAVAPPERERRAAVADARVDGTRKAGADALALVERAQQLLRDVRLLQLGADVELCSPDGVRSGARPQGRADGLKLLQQPGARRNDDRTVTHVLDEPRELCGRRHLTAWTWRRAS
mmetsp:Transcript_21267/g.57245  ORF Transcript_21267/g.57245 Transcript_21267/m.57245 type:complete len:232 (+) Transcript_21267:897-1592(+)